MHQAVRLAAFYWRQIVLVATPLLTLPLIVPNSTQVSSCAYGVILMAVFWMTEALPLAVTALLPIVIFPLLGVLNTNDACVNYLKDTNMLFLGGLMAAIAVEHSGLHMRLALRVILMVGASPRWLMLGFMLTTSVLSMWINNTATTAMMVPIIDAVMEQLEGRAKREQEQNGPQLAFKEIDTSASIDSLYHSQSTLASENSKQSMEMVNVEVSVQTEAACSHKVSPDYFRRLRIGLFLATAYACNIGGTGSLNGTAPNLVLKGVVDQLYGNETGLNFATFTLFNFPTMLLCVLLAWIWLQIVFIRPCCSRRENTDENDAIRRIIQQKYDELGVMSFHELQVLVLFFILILLWLFRDPKFISGWSVFFPTKKVHDATVVMAIAILMFALPARWGKPVVDCQGVLQHKSPPPVLTWQAVHTKLPWNVILLIGGGFAMAEAAKVSGLSKWVGQQLSIFKALPPPAIVVVISLMTAMMTEVASNTATATIFLPVLADMSQAIRVHPLYIMLPAAVACSYAFMLPIATPPNAIVFTSAGMKNTDMMLPGFVMNLLCVGVMTFMINTLGVYMFDLNTFPTWAEDGTDNTTALVTMATLSALDVTTGNSTTATFNTFS